MVSTRQMPVGPVCLSAPLSGPGSLWGMQLQENVFSKILLQVGPGKPGQRHLGACGKDRISGPTPGSLFASS